MSDIRGLFDGLPHTLGHMPRYTDEWYRQMTRLPRLLDSHLGGLLIERQYRGPDEGWYLCWWPDGPTVEHMYAIVHEFAPVVAKYLRYRRGWSDIGQATSLLLWLDADPARALKSSARELIEKAGDEVSWPERAARIWRDRAYRLLDRTGAGVLLPAAAEELTERIRAVGWTETLAWLDEYHPTSQSAHQPSEPPIAPQ